MKISEVVRRVVVFVELRRADGSAFLKGTAVVVQSKAERLPLHHYLITARHVVDGIRRTGVQDVWIRTNPADGGDAVSFPLPLEGWFVHPDRPELDVALFEITFPMRSEHQAVPFEWCATEEQLLAAGAWLGQEVFVVGLFHHHHGSRRNIPIVRVGSLACLTEERVSTRSFGDIDAYLIEVRSIGGLSGSPVFMNFPVGGPFFLIGHGPLPSPPPRPTLIGLIHGHFDSEAEPDEMVNAFELSRPVAKDKINTGIAIVIPFHSVVAVIEAYEASISTN